MSGIQSTPTRKEREFQAREELILTHARRLLLEKGFQAWNMEQLAESVEYSKGTLYQHFISKEDLVLAVATASLRQRADLFEKSSHFKGLTRERCRVIGFACCEFAVSCPEYFHVEMMLKSASFWEKASEARRQAHAFQGARCWRVLNHIIVEAMALGEMPRTHFTPEQATFALVSVTVGSHLMGQEPQLKVQAGITSPMLSVRFNQDIICDGLGWKPLLHEHDYAATDRRIVEEVFPNAASWLYTES
ncbi:TetR/AcrR family transcriptional regulator [Prosthecobacter dejongeii]|uniref:AcrR family transcriptional regulator n=1 Tax=Prosthecobacter dejongeii TaxID=48465 RepID=A0A7W8DQ81_9BACT|nr:TetR/AcrR family transcriptional regulator [Prosthecobacter dejongeii]MBB5038072.1 AcrR family transcriptional regulator [Prosthecobacter dejongeii]